MAGQQDSGKVMKVTSRLGLKTTASTQLHKNVIIRRLFMIHRDQCSMENYSLSKQG